MKNHRLRSVKNVYGVAAMLGFLLIACSNRLTPHPNEALGVTALSSCTPTNLTAGSYRLTSRNSGKALDVAGAQLQNGAKIIQFTDGGRVNQQWELSAVAGGFYKLIAKHSDKALDVSRKSQDNGAAVHQWNYVGSDNQFWCPNSVGGGYYKLLAKHSGKALDVSDKSRADGAALQQWNSSGGTNQQWKEA